MPNTNQPARKGLTLQVTDEERALLKEVCDADDRSYKKQFLWMAMRRLIEIKKQRRKDQKEAGV